MRVLNIVTEQTRALRKRKLVADFQQTYEDTDQPATPGDERLGTYRGITTKIDRYEVPALVSDSAKTASLQSIRTRLNEFSEREHGEPINWGYALTYTAAGAFSRRSGSNATS